MFYQRFICVYWCMWVWHI